MTLVELSFIAIAFIGVFGVIGIAAVVTGRTPKAVTKRLNWKKNLDKKALQRNKDVIYTKESGVLENIPTLHFNNTTRKFTLRKQSQPSALKTLGPTRKKKNKSSKRPKSPESEGSTNRSNN